MIKVSIVSKGEESGSMAMLEPVRVNRGKLYEEGIDVRIGEEVSDESDIVIVDSRIFKEARRAKEDESVYAFLEWLRDKAGRLIFFDTTDGSGGIQWDIMPYVWSYCKVGICKDRKYYLSGKGGQRAFLDYYGVDGGKTVGVAKGEDLDKLGVYWNTGLSNYGRRSFANRILGRVVGWRGLGFCVKGGREGVAGRFRTEYKDKRLSYHRKKISEILGNGVKFLNKPNYLKELEKSKICVSPFGCGEIAQRDFESFISGCLLMKPDMSHMVTWPDFYEDGVTYKSFKWDLSDLSEQIEYMLSGTRWKQIAEQGQERYRGYMVNGGHRFARQFFRVIGL